MSQLFPLLSRSAMLLALGVAFACGIYPCVVWGIGQVAFPFQANGSLIADKHGVIVGSRLIAQPFTNDEYFWPRPSAASYDATASAASNLAASNPSLRERVARALGPMVRYRSGPKAGQPVGPDIEHWLREDHFRGRPGIVAQWAALHPGESLPSKLDGKDIQGIFFDMWRQDHPDADLETIAADAVMTSDSGLDPHITVANAERQLPRVAAKWSADTHRDDASVRREIEALVRKNQSAPFAGLAGEPIVDVLELNLALRDRYGGALR